MFCVIVLRIQYLSNNFFSCIAYLLKIKLIRQCNDHFIMHMCEYVQVRTNFFIESKKMISVNYLIEKIVRYFISVHFRFILCWCLQTTVVDFSVIPRKFLLSSCNSLIVNRFDDTVPYSNTLIVSNLLARKPLQISQISLL